MANCTNGNCGHAAAAHAGRANTRLGILGAQCSQCVNKAAGSAQCAGLTLASANCAEGACGHPVVNHYGLGLGCGDCAGLAVKCPGGLW